MSTITLLCIALAGVIMLLLLVIKAKVQPFVALLLVSLLVALAAGIPAGEVGKVMIAGMGGVLGSVTIIIGLGAMLGRMIEHSGGAESLANYFSRKLGDKRTIAALTLAAFFLGIPVFFDVGFIILAPIIYGFAKVAKISPLKFGLPVAGIMLTVHVAVPPHPGPVAAAGLLHADIGWLTIIGIAISIPVGVVGYFALMNPLMILVKIIKLRWIHILSYDQMVSRKINNQTTRCANSIFYTTLFTNSAPNYT